MTVRAFHPLVGKPAHNAKPIEKELGWLSPVRKSVGDPRLWLLKCRCGNEVWRELNNVRYSLREGNTPKCSKTCAYSEPGAVFTDGKR